jgi:hypothetical protein
MKNRIHVICAIVWLAVCPNSFAQMARLGTIAERLTEHDLRAIAALLPPDHSAPFLLQGHRSQVLPESWYIDAYLLPDSDRAQVRRGAVLTMSSVLTNGMPSDWRIEGTARYAQVGVAGRPFPRAVGMGDVDRPFLVNGEFTDNELRSIVAFIRTSPSQKQIGVGLPLGTSQGRLEVHGSWPIVEIRRTPSADSMIILTLSGGVGETVVLRSAGRGWTILEVGSWLV